MSDKISIIIPAYNCEKTIHESVESVINNKIKIDFEIIITDDCSVDNTKNEIIRLQKEYGKELIFLNFHKKNKGGGAARNTAIKNSTGNLIVILDSDNLIEKGSIQKLYEHLKEKKCDAVCFENRKWFSTNIYNIQSTDTFEVNNEPLNIYTYFTNKDCAFVNNFHLYTKESFEISGGYPEHHGFDTQSFGLRWLSKGLKAYVCPDTTFYHRRFTKDKSYFEREYESGLYSENYYLVFEDILYLFSNEAKEFIINFDTKNNISFNNSIFNDLKQKFPKEELLFEKNYKSMLVSNISESTFFDKNNIFNKYWLGTRAYLNKDFENSSKYFMSSIINNNNSLRSFEYIINSLNNINNKYDNIFEKLYLQTSINNSGKVTVRETFCNKVKNKFFRIVGIKL